ncbi:MAG TPA: hypothetical protein VJ799_13005 [Nitrososphaeraceae archaeon]|nr:hypothetical protein [Nitrososphaeraceae archaeon]
MVQFLEVCFGIGTITAVVYAIKTYNSSKEKKQYDLSKVVQDDLLNFNKELSAVDNNNDQAKELLYERLFNTLEWLGFLINEKQITNNKIRQYFKKIVIQYYENTFLKTDYITSKQRTDADELKEFKKLYSDYKKGEYD